MRFLSVLRLSALIAGLSAIVCFTFYLGLNYGRAVIFTEPNPYIRIPEIIWGLFSIPMLILFIREEIIKVIENGKS